MPTILELSDEPKYTIKAVSAQTGVRPVTLRAWERRHEVLTPHRSENRYRLYSERDVAILRWLKDRTDSGLSISEAVAELRQMVRNGLWPEAVPTAPQGRTQATDVVPEVYATQLYKALIRHDEMRAGELFREALAGYDLPVLFEQVLVPCLTQIGEAWYRGEIRVTTEHFASSFLRGKLLTLFQTYPIRRGSAYIMVGGAPYEQHELGSLMFAILLRSEGYRVEYLGPDIPLDDLVDYAREERPAMIVLAASAEESALAMRRLQEKLARLRPAPLFGYGGAAFIQQPDLIQRVPGIYLGATLSAGVERVRSLLDAAPRTSRQKA
ncbi:MerR family transcriptional regulator [Thermanaerothrix sp.]|jgi:DNA-binding transcriptional MerR regulator/methylmalonyl-CoA mutase cobalamin-binding subunit|uniref:MerR family transcriptional regulator n=1 Tax=Thermanaerothrix sp. TaxID=2972675 RepID=UPI002ADE1B74|nr:MerR family transcriptional regulator [Thermanaerothrix sp.]